MNDRDWLAHLEFFGIKLGLDTITAILDQLGQPHRTYPVIHIAGTNGKGSVASMVSHALTAAGHRTGRYTSPHLVTLEERFAIDGASVRADHFDAALGRVRAAVEGLAERGGLSVEPTYFEVTTAVAFEIFRRPDRGRRGRRGRTRRPPRRHQRRRARDHGDHDGRPGS